MAKNKNNSPQPDKESTTRPTDMVPTIIRANVNREVVASPGFVSMYTNDTQLQVTPWDIRLIFGEITEPPTIEHPTAVIKLLGEVRMSPQHAKLVAALLQAQLKHYEETVGPIPVPH
jgi:hypothetical protein